MLERERRRVADASRSLAADGLVLGTAGNVSERAGELVAVTPTGCMLEDLEADQIAVVDLTGRHLHGAAAATSELALHLGIYHRYGSGAVVHTHAPMGTALSCVLDELPVIHYQMLELGGAVRVAPYATFGTTELAELTLGALHDRSAALMSNHGTIAHGSDLDTALSRSRLLEWACSLYWHAAAIGTPRILDEDQRAAFITTLIERGYGTTRPTAPPPAPAAGLCNSCRHQQIVRTTRGSVFSLCRRSRDEPERFPRYPRLPVTACPGHEPAEPDARPW